MTEFAAEQQIALDADQYSHVAGDVLAAELRR